jgi:hypothetical protein
MLFFYVHSYKEKNKSQNGFYDDTLLKVNNKHSEALINSANTHEQRVKELKSKQP